MDKEKISHLKQHEQKVINGIESFIKGEKMFEEAIANKKAEIKQLTEAFEKAEAGRKLIVSGYTDIRKELEEAEIEIERLKSSISSSSDLDKKIIDEVSSDLDKEIIDEVSSDSDEKIINESDSDSDKKKKKKSRWSIWSIFDKKKKKKKKKTKSTIINDKEIEQEISSDPSKIDIIENEFVDEAQKVKGEIDEENIFIDSLDIKGEREKMKQGIPLFSRRDRNRLIMLSFILGASIAFFRIFIDGWPIIVWPPYNDLYIHENSLIRRSIRWFIEDLIAVKILDFEPLPPGNDAYGYGGTRNGNDALTIPRKYRGKNADMYHG